MYYEIPPCCGPFKDVITEYIEYKRGLGFDYGRETVYRLREIALFFKQHGVTAVEVTEDIFSKWNKRRRNESIVNQRKRTAVLIAFSKYLALRGFRNL